MKTSIRKITSYIKRGITPVYTDDCLNSIVVLNQKCNRDYRISFDDARLHDIKKKKISPEKYLQSYDVIINATGVGTAGRVAQIGLVNDKVTTDSHMLVLRCNDCIDKSYYGWLLKSLQGRIEMFAEGSTGQTEMNKDLILDIEFDLPSFENQIKISNLLNSIDSRISLNEEINDNLQQQASSIFRNYLIKFDNIPAGWEIGSLDSIADYINGLAMQKYPPKNNEVGLPVLKISELKQGFCDSNSDRCTSDLKSDYIINNGDVIFSWSASLVVDIWAGGKAGLNQHLFNVKSKKYDKWFYYWWTKYYLNEFIHEALAKATTMGHIKRDSLSKAKVLIPSDSDYKSIANILEPLTDSIIKIKLENQRLSELRDALLPKLMSGEIDVSNIKLDL